MKLKYIILISIVIVLCVGLFVRAELTAWEEDEIRSFTLTEEQLNELPKDKQPKDIQAKLVEDANIFSSGLREYKIMVDGNLIGVKFGLHHLKSDDDERLKEVVKDTILEEIEFESIK